MNTFKNLIFVILFITTSAIASDDNQVTFESHNLRITPDVKNQFALILDHGLVNIPADNGWFKINKTSHINYFMINSVEVPYDVNLSEDSTFSILSFTHDNPKGVYAFSFGNGVTFNDDVENARFSNENIGREVSGTILEKGAYLSSSSYYYPQGNEQLLTFSVTADIPANWESIADGNRMEHVQKDNRKVQTWTNPYKSDGLMFMAAPYVVKDTTVNDINIACYFFAEDTSLFESYLSATVGYMEMYSEMIGPYPYNSFIVAENFFPTGYGMPGWTLLGQQVIRLPFIKYTSLGHEVLHNWWGNSVYVDYDRGNWCESATVYGADYRYKLMRSESSAMAYRKDILKQYVSYVNDGNDFPIREFTSRTSKNTRTIGYNKAMMVYHMIEEEIGSDAFWQAWKDIYAEYITKKISWEEWISAFEKTSGKDLSHIIPQWIDQTGAPVLSLESASKDENNVATFTLKQNNNNPYSLQVPIHFTYKSGKTVNDFDTVVTMNELEQTYTMDIKSLDKIEIDPEFHLFRKLYPEEVEPIVSAVLGFENQMYAIEKLESIGADAFTQFAQNMNGEDQKIISTQKLANGNDSTSAIFLNPSTIPDYVSDKIEIVRDTVIIDGMYFPLEGHTFILSGDNFNEYKKCLVALTSDFESLARLGQLIPHYGKYSYLVFKGSKNIAKGQWETDSSPLKMEL